LPDGSRYCPSCGADSTDPGSGRVVVGSTEALLRQVRSHLGERYEVHDVLGRGGMGAVFRATEKKLDRQVAIKVLPPELAGGEDIVQRFQREARTAAKLDHAGIIPIYAVEDEGELQYFVMKYVRGHPLDDEIDRGPLAIERVQRIVWEAAVALGHAHQRGVVHRDIKPGNIMMEGGERVLLTDFGISKAFEGTTQFTATGQVIGTPAFMSPEQAKGTAIDGRSDQYSLALVAYQLLAGRLPFEDATVHTLLYKQIFEDPPPLAELRPDVPPFLAAAIHRALEKEPDARFASMEEFANVVRPESSVSVPAAVPPPEGARPRRAVPRMLGVAAVVVVLGGIGTAAWLLRDGAGGGATAVSGAPRVASSTTPTATAASDSLAAPAGDSAAAPRETITVAAPATPPANDARASRQPPPVSPPAAPAVGYLTVGADPWGTVLIDGVEVRSTPLTRHALAPGRYVVEVRRAGYQTSVDTVAITASNSTILRKVLVREP